MILVSAFQLTDHIKPNFFFFLSDLGSKQCGLKSENSSSAKKPRMFKGLKNKREQKGSLAIQWIKAKSARFNRQKKCYFLVNASKLNRNVVGGVFSGLALLSV